MRAGDTEAAARAALSALAPQVKAAAMPDERTSAADRDGFMAESFVVTDLATGRSIFRKDLVAPLTIIMCVVGAVLLIACANIANVLLARASARRHELSVRLALGASRWRIVRQLFIESFLLAATGAVGGLLFARGAGALLVRQFTLRTMTVTLDLDPDWRVFAFTAGVTVITTLLFGLAPAAGVSSLSPQSALKEQNRGVSGDRRVSVRHALVVLQVALSLALAVGAGLFVRTFSTLAATPVGFDPASLLVVNVNLGRSGLAPEARLGEYDRLRDAAAAVPGVRSATLSFMTPLSGRSILTFVEKPGMSDAPAKDKFQRLMVNTVSPEYFDTYQMHLLAGHAFDRGDSASATKVAVINETLARALFGSPNAVGRDLIGNLGAPDAKRFTVVGVVNDTLYRSARNGVDPIAYIPIAQAGPAGSSASLTVAASGAPDTVARDLSTTLGQALPAASLSVKTFNTQIRSTFSQERLLAQLSGFFGALSVLLAAVGLFGVTSYSVSRRRGEIAIRMALGSTAGRVVRLVLWRVVTLVIAGAVLGAALSLWASRFVAALLFGVPPGDVVTLVTASFVMIAVGLVAGWLPARRASRIDPTIVLRN
jgi:predicted permease